MTQLVDVERGAATTVGEYDAICRVVRLFLDGEATGDRAKLTEALHEDARMFGSLPGRRLDMSIAAFIDLAASAPGDTGYHCTRILAVAQTGDAAFVTAAEEGFWGTLSFIDYLSLAKIDGTWKIVNKLFAHTGGGPRDTG